MVRVSEKAIKDARASFKFDGNYLGPDADTEMTAKDMVTQEATRRAEQILSQARADAEATRDDADGYVIETLSHVEDELSRLLNQVHNGIRALQDQKK